MEINIDMAINFLFSLFFSKTLQHSSILKNKKWWKLFPFGIQYSAILSLVPHSISLRSTAAWFPPTPARLRPHHHLHRRQNGSGERKQRWKKIENDFFSAVNIQSMTRRNSGLMLVMDQDDQDDDDGKIFDDFLRYYHGKWQRWCHWHGVGLHWELSWC